MYSQTKQKALSKLTFDPGKHKYTQSGLLIPSVTTVINELMPFQNMPQEVLREARERGTKVHELTCIMDADPGIITAEEDKLWGGYLDAWEAFKQETAFRILESEQRVYHTKYLYAGTFDRIGILEGKLGVLDIKTGMLYPEYALQTAAYLEAINEGRQEDKIKGRYSLQLKPDGKYKLSEYKDKADFHVFLATLTLYNWRIMNGR